MKALIHTLAAGLLLIALGCREDTQAPSAVEATPALAVTQALVFRSITAGSGYSCGVTLDDRAYCWGDNFSGELGDGTTIDRLRPVLVAGGLHFSTVSAGDNYTCGITTLQKAYCWGWNDQGMLGDGTTTDRHVPVPVKGGLAFMQIRPGDRHTCGTSTNNLGYCWGANQYGQVGDGSNVLRRLTPSRVAGTLRFIRVIAGGFHSCGLTTSNRAYCWGNGRSGQVGDGKTFLRFTPIAVAGGFSFKQVVPGGQHTCGVTTGDRAYCWGINSEGQIGDATNIANRLTPVAVAGPYLFIGVSAANEHNCGVTEQKRAVCWGWDLYGQLGNGTTTSKPVPLTTAVSGGLTFSQVAGGFASLHSCGLTPTGKAYCWGGNFDGQLGDGSRTTHSTPVAVLAPS
jgi:alpha-tubulin suppressor-like RCC1 family protein